MDIIGGRLFSNHNKNLNHVHKDSKDFFYDNNSGEYISGGDTIFYDGVEKSDLGSRAHVLNFFQRRMIFDPFGKIFHEGTLWRGNIFVISFILTKQIFLHLHRHRDRLYKQYINKTDRKRYLYYYNTRVKPEHYLQRGIIYTSG